MRGFTTMNIVVTLLKILVAVVLYISSVTTASINKEVVDKSKNEVVKFMDVYKKSQCQPREVLVDILQEYPEDTAHTYIPSCVVLSRCGGCCNDDSLECVPTETRNMTLQDLQRKLALDVTCAVDAADVRSEFKKPLLMGVLTRLLSWDTCCDDNVKATSIPDETTWEGNTTKACS